MKTNALPHYDNSVNTTGCCAKFNTAGWDGVKLQFDEKRFARATTKSLAHIPINMGSVFERVLKNMETAGAFDANNYIVLSRDLSPWKAEHLFAIATPLPQEEAVTLTGNFVTKVFEGSYSNVERWHDEIQRLPSVANGEKAEVYFFYTTCPKCAKAYGENYVVGVARTS